LSTITTAITTLNSSMHRFVALAVCLLVAGASAFASASCGPQGLMGGWAPITDDNSTAIEDVINAAVAEFESVYSTNVTDWLPCEQPSLNFNGCQQVHGGHLEQAACPVALCEPPAACRLPSLFSVAALRAHTPLRPFCRPAPTLPASPQVVAGMNYKLLLNVTCPSGNGTDLTVGMAVEAFQGLDGAIQVRALLPPLPPPQPLPPLPLLPLPLLSP
jgi:hypothetical protein